MYVVYWQVATVISTTVPTTGSSVLAENVQFAQEELERYKHEAILEHKEALIEKLRGDLKIAERRLEAATNSKGQASSNASQGLPQSVMSNHLRPPGDRWKIEASRSRDEKFAHYAAMARSKMKARN